MVGKPGNIVKIMSEKINFKTFILLVTISVCLIGCKQEKDKDDSSFTFISKDDYFVEYSSLDIYRNAETKKPLNGYYVVGKDLTKWEELNVENGILNGEYLFYHPNSNVSIRSNYDKGKIHGEEIYYYPSGTIQQKHT